MVLFTGVDEPKLAVVPYRTCRLAATLVAQLTTAEFNVTDPT
jgi:hypothetical protein